jgi:hypothetical protein
MSHAARQLPAWLIFDVGQKTPMHWFKVSPVVLSAGSSLAIVAAFAFVRAISPELHFDRWMRSQWLELFFVECASAFALFFLAKGVRGARWLWLVWLVAAADCSLSEMPMVWASYYSSVLTGVYLAWAVKVVVLAMLFVPRQRSAGSTPQTA